MKLHLYKHLFACLALLLISFQVCGSVESAYKEADLSLPGMMQLVREKPDQFVAKWNARRKIQDDQLASLPASEAKEKEKQRIQWEWASGFINYPYFHQRETGEPVIPDWTPKKTAILSIPFNDADKLQSAQYLDLIQAWLHDQGGQIIKTEAEFKQGDNRWLRAYFVLIERTISNREVKRILMTRLLKEHIDENGAKNTGPQIDALERFEADKQQIQTFRAALARELTPPDDHLRFVYQQVGGVDLQLHVFPASRKNDASPVFIWFHGGSWSTGHWSYCPVLCRSLREQGFVVIQAEYRTSQRFDGTPLDALADAYKIIDWAIEHAKELNIAPQKLMVGGFSSGASLAAQMAVLNSNKVSAAAYIAGCFDPSKDSWYNSVVAARQNTRQLSPLHMLNADVPPQIFFHAKDDEMCAYPDAQAMTHQLTALGVPNRLISFEQGGHFFIFKSPDDRKRVSTELGQFVDTLKWKRNEDQH
jgi:acetyl esterase/lipase